MPDTEPQDAEPRDAEPQDAESPLANPRTRAAARRLARTALEAVQDPSGRVRAEDYLAVLASLTGEAALYASGISRQELDRLTPGSAVFGDQINGVLSGDTPDPDKVPAESVYGIFLGELVPAVLPLDSMPSLDELYHHVAASVGKSPWGHVAISVAADHRPRVIPLQVTLALRGSVDAAQTEAGLPDQLRHVPCALALTQAIGEVRSVLKPEIAAKLGLEVAIGMAKMVPMTQAALEAAHRPDWA